MILEFEDEKGLLDEQARGLMQLCADAAQRTEGVSCPLSVFISVVGDEQIREINREQRGKDAATDVLSFRPSITPGERRQGSASLCSARSMIRTRMRVRWAIS